MLCWEPAGLALDPGGALLVADIENHRVLRFPRGERTGQLVAGGNGEGDALDQLDGPTGIALDVTDGSYVMVDCGNQMLRRLSADGIVSDIAGAPGQRGHADGAGAEARFNNPYAVAVDAAGTIFVADGAHFSNHCVRRVTREGVVGRAAGVARVRVACGRIARWRL